ncbi:hypothetical protein ACFU99_16665 [Streptomyces sp. NPDC057654]|uniref:hypothetical protein n=1 Tax=Streptomyces sp. NPDC057654 TaxID=3346196 RepID=UPI0036805BA0
MNWADLVEALLVAGLVLPLLIRIFGLIPVTAFLAFQTTALALMTIRSFLQGDAQGTAWCASLTVFLLLKLRSRSRRHKTPVTDRTAGKGQSQDRDRGTDQVYVITTVKKP